VNHFDSTQVLRRRSVWEAADSGLLLWRNGFFHFIPFFALPAWIIACGLRFLPGNFVYLSYLVLWWLKPLFDRLVLHVVSRNFFAFSASNRFMELRKGLWGNLFRGLLGDLLWRRFSPGRAARMPIRVLEQVSFGQYRLRKKALAAGGLDFCSFISFLGLLLEGGLLLGEVLFAAMITELFFPTALRYMLDNPDGVEIFIFAAYCLNFILVESLYVCMGFGLYINSRVEIEGWDLQLLFQKFAALAPVPEKVPAAEIMQNSAPAASRTGITIILFLCLLLGRLFAPALPAVYADTREIAASSSIASDSSPESDDSFAESDEYFPPDFPVPDTESLENLKTVLSSPDFGGEKETWGIRFKHAPGRPEVPDGNLGRWVELVRRVFGFILRFAVVLVIAGFVFFSLYWFWKHRRKGVFRFRSGGKSYANPLISPESPESLFARAEASFGRGNFREAWAACLAGCIGAYSVYRSLSFPVDTTEYGCLELVRRALPGEAGGFDSIVQTWILFAYGGREPDPDAFNTALAYGRSIREIP